MSQAVPVTHSAARAWASLGPVTPQAALSAVNIVLRVGGDMLVSILSIRGPMPSTAPICAGSSAPGKAARASLPQAAPEPGAGVLEQGRGAFRKGPGGRGPCRQGRLGGTRSAARSPGLPGTPPAPPPCLAASWGQQDTDPHERGRDGAQSCVPHTHIGKRCYNVVGWSPKGGTETCHVRANTQKV